MSKNYFYLFIWITASNSLPAQNFELNPFIDLDKSICKMPDKHLTLQSSKFLEYIGAEESKVFDCGKSAERGNAPCDKEPELICRSQHSKQIISRAQSILEAASEYVTNNPKLKNKRKFETAIKSITENIDSWTSAKTTVDYIPSLEREIIYTSSLLPREIYQTINRNLKDQHESKRTKLLAEKKRKEEEAKQKAAELAAELAAKQAAEKKAQQDKLAAEQAFQEKIFTYYFVGMLLLIFVISLMSYLGSRKNLTT